MRNEEIEFQKFIRPRTSTICIRIVMNSLFCDELPMLEIKLRNIERMELTFGIAIVTHLCDSFFETLPLFF